MKYLGVDIGSKRVGVAISDDAGTVAFPLEVLSREACIDRMAAIIDERNISAVVIGESLALDGSENPIMQDVRAVADALRGKAEIIFQPEQFSTQEASRLGKGSDAEAATIILQSYLDRHAPDAPIDFE